MERKEGHLHEPGDGAHRFREPSAGEHGGFGEADFPARPVLASDSFYNDNALQFEPTFGRWTAAFPVKASAYPLRALLHASGTGQRRPVLGPHFARSIGSLCL